MKAAIRVEWEWKKKRERRDFYVQRGGKGSRYGTWHMEKAHPCRGRLRARRLKLSFPFHFRDAEAENWLSETEWGRVAEKAEK